MKRSKLIAFGALSALVLSLLSVV
ncbi:MAG: hypothetical protein RL694_363, partial [Actinomycetota bacterium]